MNQQLSWLRLHLTRGLGRRSLFRLIQHYGDPDAALAAGTAAWRRLPGLNRLAATPPALDDPVLLKASDDLAARESWIVSYWDAAYPPQLKTIPDPPALLYGRGRLPDSEMLAIVGSRTPTAVGRALAEELAGQLAAHGVIIVSGLARGIDAAAHRGALAAEGQTIAVLGCGIDRIYPSEHRTLAGEIVESGCLLSEYPPGTEPLPGHFPGRNRIISGLCRGTLVVEAARESGSLITAEFALDQGREVMAVPGGVDHRTCSGSNQLIKTGAHPVTEAADILQLLWPERLSTTAPPPCEPSRDDYPETAWKVLAATGPTPLHIDELAAISGLTAMEVSVILLQLELHGDVEQLPGTRYIRRPRRLSPITSARETA